MVEEKEKKYRRIGWLTSAGIQVVLLILFYFLVAWKEPFPPIPSYGIELSFGVEETGGGTEPTSTTEPSDEVELSEPVSEAPIEETTPEEVAEYAMEDDVDVAPVEESPVVETPSPDVVEETVDDALPVEEESNEQAAEEQKSMEEEKEESEEPLNPAATMPESQAEQPNDSRGNDGEEGVQGEETGSIDGRALMGEQGSADGASLQMSGWVWDFKPEPQDESAESGKIVYRIKVDDEGYLVGIELVSSTVSPVVERYYKQSVERLSFTKTNEYSPAPLSSGTITFIIRAK